MVLKYLKITITKVLIYKVFNSLGYRYNKNCTDFEIGHQNVTAFFATISYKIVVVLVYDVIDIKTLFYDQENSQNKIVQIITSAIFITKFSYQISHFFFLKYNYINTW